MELRKDAVVPNTRILLVDEWIETGAQMDAAIKLIEGQGGIVAGVVTINIDDVNGARKIKDNYDVFSSKVSG